VAPSSPRGNPIPPSLTGGYLRLPSPTRGLGIVLPDRRLSWQSAPSPTGGHPNSPSPTGGRKRRKRRGRRREMRRRKRRRKRAP